MKKWRDQGFWKSLLFYRQSVLYYWILSARYRSFTWYGAANPAIPHAGMLNERKYLIYGLLPESFLPPTFTVNHLEDVVQLLKDKKLSFPLVLKPDVGLKGIEVQKCNDQNDLEYYFKNTIKSDFIAQEYIDLPAEYSVLYYHYGTTRGISSFVEKRYPSVQGDGVLSMHQLIDLHPHPYLDKKACKELWSDFIPAKGEVFKLHEIGNYARGATFHSLLHEINDELLAGVRKCMDQVKDVNFCRLDIKAKDIPSICNGSFKIIEVNGGKSEPIHIYDTRVSFWQALKDIHRHWVIYTRVVNDNLQKGYKMVPTAEGVKALIQIKKVVKQKRS